ncbi:hypothetical protein FB451DRAFT_1527541 [Mycena latifolia]|nr:hypothetical protein FB451DRAFT_1527541 [Mycena latifolia]
MGWMGRLNSTVECTLVVSDSCTRRQHIAGTLFVFCMSISRVLSSYHLFVACDAASSSVHLAALIGEHFGLKSVLDNLETIWESLEFQTHVEKLLALLANIDHLALMVTMRGAERPANIKWVRPFLEPLKPLAQDAAHKTFVDILKTLTKIVLLANNMPLAIDLIAHLVDYDGFDSVMYHWETERSSLLSEGHGNTFALAVFGPCDRVAIITCGPLDPGLATA